MTNNNQQHTTGLKRTLAQIGGWFCIIGGLYNMVRGVFDRSSNPTLDGVNFFWGAVMIAFGKSYLDSGRDATTLKKMLDQSEGQNASQAPQQMAPQPQTLPPQSLHVKEGMAYRNDFAAREAIRAGNQAEVGAGRGAS